MQVPRFMGKGRYITNSILRKGQRNVLASRSARRPKNPAHVATSPHFYAAAPGRRWDGTIYG
jgi:hypothetical protein